MRLTSKNHTHSARSGISLVEVLVVMAIFVIFGAIAAPTIRQFNGNSSIKAAADTVKGRLADARAAALETGRSYRFSLSEDGTRIFITADDMNSEEGEEETTIILGESTLPKNTKAEVVTGDGATNVDDSGNIRVVTFRPDGTCREDSATIRITEQGQLPLLVNIRGLTGAATIEKTQGGTTP